MLGYAARVEEERLMWQPLVNEERREREEKERAEERKRRKWRAAFPTVSEYTPDEGITVHRDGSRLFNQLLLLRAADQEWCSENRYTLTPSIVVAEILRFIDVSPGSSCSSAATTSAAEEPLYTTLGQELRISKRYQPVRDVKGKKKHGYNIYASGMFYLDTRLQLDNIQLFIDETRRAEATKIHWIPESVKALSSFAQQFLIDHNADLRRLQDQEIANLARLVSRTHTTRGRVDLVYKLVEPFRGETRWNHEKVDKLWAYVFSFTIEPLVIAEYQGPLLRRLQLDLLFVFLLFADNLYSFGQCPRQLNDEFVFYEPLESVLQALQVGGATAAAGSLSTTPTTSATGTTVVAAPVAGKPRTSLSLVSSSMVSASMMRATVKECRVAVRDARYGRVGMSSLELERLPLVDADGCADEGKTGQGAPLSFVTIRAALLSAACGCTHALTQEFMAAFRVEGRLSNVLSDAKSIFIGSAMCSYAGSLRGGAAVRPAELREAFSRSLVDAKIPIERRKRWGVDTEEKYGRIVARLEWPLPYVLHPPLLSLLGDARHFILNLLRCSEIIMDIQCDVEHPVAEDCRRPFLLLMRNLLQLITLISELFYKQAQVLVDRYFARVDASTTVDEARGHADALHDRLRDLVGSSGIRKMVRELVDMFCKMAEEIHLFLLSGKITSMEVFKWSKVVERERAMLISMGENMTKNVLADLVTMLKVR